MTATISQTRAERARGAARDGFLALKLALVSSKMQLLNSLILIPCGVFCILAYCFGIEALLKLAGFSFPPSVAGLIILFAVLLLSEAVVGNSRTKRLVSVFDIPGGWAMRWINLFFAPSFITLPLSTPISGVEVAKIIAVFVLGWVITVTFTAFFTRGLQALFGSRKKSHQQSPEEEDTSTELVGVVPASASASEATLTPSIAPTRPATVFGGLTAPLPRQGSPGQESLPVEDPILDTDPRDPASSQASYIEPDVVPALSPRVASWTARISGHLNTLIYASISLAGIPIYYVTGYAMPLHLGCCVLTYLGSLYVPARHRTYLHPLLVSSTASVLVIWALAAVKGDSLHTALRQFKTGVNFYSLLSQPDKRRAPGAGDIFGAALDVGIVALALPMHRYRRELREHFFVILLPTLTLSVASIFAYPVASFAIGIGAQRSLALASRSLTLALALPATQNLGGDINTVAAVAVMSGILGALFGQRMLTWMRVPKEDFITRGITLGANSAAIITALLLQSDPRAAAMSSLAMSLFGTITVSLTSIPPLANTIRSLVL